jgi:hypothetical protein
MIVKDKLHPDVQAWEVKINNTLHVDWEKVKFEPQHQKGKLFSPSSHITKRLQCFNKKIIKNLYSKININTIKKYIPNAKDFEFFIFKDLPGFEMFPHTDPTIYIGFLVLNLTNNNNSTEFFDWDDNFICKSSNIKNEGVLHYLRAKPKIKHLAKNTSNKNRYTTIAFIK